MLNYETDRGLLIYVSDDGIPHEVRVEAISVLNVVIVRF